MLVNNSKEAGSKRILFVINFKFLEFVNCMEELRKIKAPPLVSLMLLPPLHYF